jgi:hypothetical protein
VGPDGKKYCLQKAGITAAGVQVCFECLTALQKKAVPAFSLVRFDAGSTPLGLEPLTWIESMLVAPVRAKRYTVVLRTATGFQRHRAIRGHVIGVSNPPLGKLQNFLLPHSTDSLVSYIQIVFIRAVRDDAELLRLAQQTQVLKIRGAVVAMWVEHLCRAWGNQWVQKDDGQLQVVRSLNGVPEVLLQRTLLAQTDAAAVAMERTFLERTAGCAPGQFDADREAAGVAAPGAEPEVGGAGPADLQPELPAQVGLFVAAAHRKCINGM